MSETQLELLKTRKKRGVKRRRGMREKIPADELAARQRIRVRIRHVRRAALGYKRVLVIVKKEFHDQVIKEKAAAAGKSVEIFLGDFLMENLK